MTIKKNHFISCLFHFDGRETTSSFKETLIKNRGGKDWTKQLINHHHNSNTVPHTHSCKQHRGPGPTCASGEGRNSWSEEPVWQKRGSCWLVKFHLMEENESGTWEVLFGVLKLPNNWKAGRCRRGEVGGWAAGETPCLGCRQWSCFLFSSLPITIWSLL